MEVAVASTRCLQVEPPYKRWPWVISRWYGSSEYAPKGWFFFYFTEQHKVFLKVLLWVLLCWHMSKFSRLLISCGNQWYHWRPSCSSCALLASCSQRFQSMSDVNNWSGCMTACLVAQSRPAQNFTKSGYSGHRKISKRDQSDKIMLRCVGVGR